MIRHHFGNTHFTQFSGLILCLLSLSVGMVNGAEFHVGAAKVDVTPEKLPVLINGGMISRKGDKIVSRLYARAIVVKQGDEHLAMVVVDSCMMSREVLDSAKQLASKRTGIPVENMMISATHAHSVPASMGCLGTDADPRYVPLLRLKLADVITKANEQLQPAVVGANTIDGSAYTAVRRWVRRPDKMSKDPFGNLTVRANMHPGHLSPDAMGPSGPTDPDLSVVVFRSKANKAPIAVFANFCMHYFGGPTIGSDYFGFFADHIEKAVGKKGQDVVAMMSHGTSGDIWRRDYLKPPVPKPHTLESYSEAMAELALTAIKEIKYQTPTKTAMAEAKLPLRYRVPDLQRLQWAQKIVDGMKGRLPKTQTEVYAREAVILHEKQKTEIILQAIRIGDIGFTAIPNEVYALTGLKLKELSPLKWTINIDLANGGEGYIPPPEQHNLGGYNTWPARSAGLEVQAEPKIVETVCHLLEQVAGKPRRTFRPSMGKAGQAILAAKPMHYYRLNEFEGSTAYDESKHRHGRYELGVVYFLEGARSSAFRRSDGPNRAPHFAGERMTVLLDTVGNEYSVSLWMWNGMPNNARNVNGILFSRGKDHAAPELGQQLGINGKTNSPGTLFFSAPSSPTLKGKTVLKRWTWYHVVLVKGFNEVRVYVNGQLDALSTLSRHSLPSHHTFIGGSYSRENNFEGRIDEVAIWNRVLKEAEVKKLFEATR